MDKQEQYNILKHSGEADCSHYDAAGKSILGKRRIEEDRNKYDPLKHVHLPELKKQKSGKSVNPYHSEALNKIVGKMIIEKDNNGSEESNLWKNTFWLTNTEVGMDKQEQYKILKHSGEADCSHYDAAGKSILGKRRIEDRNKYDPLKHVHLPELKKQKSGETVNPDHSEALNKIVGKMIIEKDNNGSEERNLIPKLKKPIKQSAVRYFPPGCGRYASPVAPVSFKSSPQKFLKPPVYTSGYYTSGYGRDVPSVSNEQYQLSAASKSHTDGVKGCSQQHAKFRGNLESTCVNKEDGARNKEDGSRNREKKSMLSFRNRENEIMQPCRPVLKQSSEVRYKKLQNFKVRPKTQNVNQVARMIKKEANPGHCTVKVQGLCSGPCKGATTPKELSTKNVRTKDAFYPLSTKNVRTREPETNAPKLPPSKSLANAVLKFGKAHTRPKARETLRLFQVVCRKLLQNHETQVQDPALAGKCLRIDLKASKILRDNNLYVNTGKQIVGAVPGVEVGDQFHYRIELCIVGLHRQIQAGIDFLKPGNVPLATSIVASGGYEDDIDGGDLLIYTGHGGNNYSGDRRQNKNQKLERGNLALKNSIDRKIPVRVVRGYKQKNTGIHENRKGRVSVIYTYDGLYDVQKYWLDTGASGYSVFKFQLKRQPGQPELGLKAVQFIGSAQKYPIREGLRVKDISGGKERKCICAVNTIDEESLPIFFYTTEVIYPYGCTAPPPRGCDCKDGCLDPSKCLCASKNGGEFPFNYDGAIVRSKPIVYECGPSCKCSATCHNRVSQHGVRYTIEVFKTDKRGWGVRSLDSIPSGGFVCEYTGNLLSDTEAEKCVGNDEYLFDIGRNCNSRDQSLWSDLSSLMPDIEAGATSDLVEDGGFTIDAAECGNVGRFVNHSCSPNLYAQNVLYDHDDRKLPHIMLFAAENIPPMRELCYHYNYSLDEVRDSDGNIKTKPCYCGSSECIGRMY